MNLRKNALILWECGKGYDYEVSNFISWKFFAISYFLNQKMVQSSH